MKIVAASGHVQFLQAKIVQKSRPYIAGRTGSLPPPSKLHSPSDPSNLAILCPSLSTQTWRRHWHDETSRRNRRRRRWRRFRSDRKTARPNPINPLTDYDSMPTALTEPIEFAELAVSFLAMTVIINTEGWLGWVSRGGYLHIAKRSEKRLRLSLLINVML